jgi:diadenosine tetraphosphate (Ap4A) HIT family hydrolase
MNKEGCLFCDENFYDEENLIFENNFWIVVYDRFSISKGHVLIIPKRHVESIFNLSFEFLSLFNVIKMAKKHLDDRFSPDGYNIGINDGVVSGQTVKHTHIHLIPRYNNDGGLPCGVRNVFPPHLADYRKYF